MARRLCTVLVASLFLLTAACGTTDDDKADEKTETKDDATTTTEGDDSSDTTEDGGDDGDETTTTEGGGGGDTEFCAAAADLNTMFDDLDEGDYQGMVDAIADAEDTFDAYLEALPAGLKEQGKLLVESVKTLAEAVDAVKDDPDVEAKVEAAYSDLDTPELNEAGDAVDAYEDENCPDN